MSEELVFCEVCGAAKLGVTGRPGVTTCVACNARKLGFPGMDGKTIAVGDYVQGWDNQGHRVEFIKDGWGAVWADGRLWAGQVSLMTRVSDGPLSGQDGTAEASPGMTSNSESPDQ